MSVAKIKAADLTIEVIEWGLFQCTVKSVRNIEVTVNVLTARFLYAPALPDDLPFTLSRKDAVIAKGTIPCRLDKKNPLFDTNDDASTNAFGHCRRILTGFDFAKGDILTFKAEELNGPGTHYVPKEEFASILWYLMTVDPSKAEVSPYYDLSPGWY